MHDSGCLSAVYSASHATFTVRPNPQTALQPRRRSPSSAWSIDVVNKEIHFLLNSLAIRCRNTSSPPEDQHLHHMTVNFPRASSLVQPEGAIHWDRSCRSVQQAPSAWKPSSESQQTTAEGLFFFILASRKVSSFYTVQHLVWLIQLYTQ